MYAFGGTTSFDGNISFTSNSAVWGGELIVLSKFDCLSGYTLWFMKVYAPAVNGRNDSMFALCGIRRGELGVTTDFPP